MIENFLDKHRYTLMTLLSVAILLGSGISLGVGLFGDQTTETAKVSNVTKVSEIQAENDPLDQKININTATASELDLLPGIGPSKAKAIIEYREKNGSFQTITEIQNVSGIGPKTFEKLKDLITVK